MITRSLCETNHERTKMTTKPITEIIDAIIANHDLKVDEVLAQATLDPKIPLTPQEEEWHQRLFQAIRVMQSLAEGIGPWRNGLSDDDDAWAVSSFKARRVNKPRLSHPDPQIETLLQEAFAF